MENNFKIGDRVRMTSDWCWVRKGMTGTIKCIYITDMAVEFDKSFKGGHDCFGVCKRNRGHYIPFHFIELIDPKEPSQPTERFKEQKGDNAAMSRIIIEYTPNETKIKRVEGKKVTGETSVKRYKDDKDDEYIAIMYAVDKLFGKLDKPEPKKPKGFTGKAVCVKEISDFTVGKVYEFVDGRTHDDGGSVKPTVKIRATYGTTSWGKGYFINLINE